MSWAWSYARLLVEDAEGETANMGYAALRNILQM
jgi:hypothetical protein